VNGCGLKRKTLPPLEMKNEVQKKNQERKMVGGRDIQKEASPVRRPVRKVTVHHVAQQAVDDRRIKRKGKNGRRRWKRAEIASRPSEGVPSSSLGGGEERRGFYSSREKKKAHLRPPSS